MYIRYVGHAMMQTYAGQHCVTLGCSPLYKGIIIYVFRIRSVYAIGDVMSCSVVFIYYVNVLLHVCVRHIRTYV